MSLLDKIKELVRGLGGTVNEVHRLPDGSGFATASWPLRDDHWIYGSSQRPPMTMRTGTAHPRRQELQDRVREAAKYAVKAATMNGKDTDFDPDALVQNLLVGLFGYHTADGLTSMGPEEAKVADPQPVPPLFPWPQKLHFVCKRFDQSPNLTFVEVETPDGKSIDFGPWHERPDGYVELRVGC